MHFSNFHFHNLGVFIAIAMNYKYVDEHKMNASLADGNLSDDGSPIQKRTKNGAPMTPPPLSSVSPSEKDSKC